MKFGDEMAVLLEQSEHERLTGHCLTRENTTWDFYLIGRSPSLQITTRAESTEDIWHLTRRTERNTHVRHIDEFGRNCDHSSRNLGINTAFDAIVDICAWRHKPCLR